jgi:hypothetical protein
MARMWPVSGVVGENGAFYFRYDMPRAPCDDAMSTTPGRRAAFRTRLAGSRGDIMAAVPGAAIAADQHYRETDLAIDYCEDVPPLRPGRQSA